jgi:excinuclease ABC subunit C
VSGGLRRLIDEGDDKDALEGDDLPSKKSGFAYPPGLLVVDGGVPQVSAAKRAMDESGLDIPICGLAKRLEEVWLPDDEFPVILPRSSEALFILQRVRDEAHRVALSYQKTTRRRSIATQLSDIPGVGKKTVKLLLTHFGSVAALKQADREDLSLVPGVGPAMVEKIFVALHPEKGPNTGHSSRGSE